MLRLEMFFTNIDSLMPGLQNLWREVRRFLFSEETLPRLLISKAVTVVLICVMSVTKCAYLFDLSVFRWAMFTSSGTLSSNMWKILQISHNQKQVLVDVACTAVYVYMFIRLYVCLYLQEKRDSSCDKYEPNLKLQFVIRLQNNVTTPHSRLYIFF